MPAQPPAPPRHHPRAFTQVARRLSEHAARHPHCSLSPPALGTPSLRVPRERTPGAVSLPRGPQTQPSLRSGSLQGRAGPGRGASPATPGGCSPARCTPSSRSPPGPRKSSLRCLLSPRPFRSRTQNILSPHPGCPSWVAGGRPAARLGTLSSFLCENLLRLRVPSPT